MKFAWALAGASILFAACSQETTDPGEFLRKFATRENQNLVTATGGVFKYEISLLTSDFFAAREAAEIQGINADKLRSIRTEAQSRYSQGLYFMVRISREGPSRLVDGVDPEMMTLQQHLQSRQESLRHQIRLRARGRDDLFPSQVITSSIPGLNPSCTLLLAFPAPGKTVQEWEYLSLAGIESLPLATDFSVDLMRPKLRLSP